MNNNNNKTVVQTNIFHLTEIVDMLNRGEIRVPNFQRPFSWRTENMISLFESIQKGYPIGSLLFWETDSEFESLNRIGPFDTIKSKNRGIKYILDGHQRISTFYGVLKPLTELEIINKDPQWNILYDLENQEFITTQTKTNKAYIPLHNLISTFDFLKVCKKLQDDFPLDAELYIGRAEKLAQDIRAYKIPVIQIIGGGLDTAVEIFSRLNTSGVKMTGDQMLSALTYKEGADSFNLAEKVDIILDKLRVYNFGDIDRVFIFRSILAALEKDIYKIKYNTLNHSTQNLESVVEEAECSILNAAKFLNESLNIFTDKLLPYNLQLVFLSEFFRCNKNPDDESLRKLKIWFWRTSYTSWFAGANSTKIAGGLQSMRDFARGILGDLDFIELKVKAALLPDKIDFRFARVKCFVLFLASLKPKSFETGENIDVKNTLHLYGSKGLASFISNSNLTCNKFIYGNLGYNSFQKLLEENDNISIEILHSHLLTPTMLSVLRTNENRFLALRKAFIISSENTHIERLGVNPNESIDLKQTIFDIFDTTEN